jgi:glycosyltransferase involved in cell wall biosynthesis
MVKLVSVIIPTYNRKYLTDKAVASVVTAFPSLVEIVVIDDCGSLAYASENFNQCGILVRVVRLEQNVGAGMARQAGVAHASGNFIAFLDSDDCFDADWVDYVVALLQSGIGNVNRRTFITGITQGEKGLGGVVRRVLANMPQSLRLPASRVVVTMFNPFYTPSIVLSKELCQFKTGLRHCEDYYSIAFAIFSSDQIYIPNVVSCHLGREPNSTGFRFDMLC